MANQEVTRHDDYETEKISKYNKYSGFKEVEEEWVNRIPSHWESKRFRSQLGYEKGTKPKEVSSEKTEKFNIPYLSMEYLRGQESGHSYAENTADIVLADNHDTLLLWDGSKAGEFVRAKKGAVSSTMAILFQREENNSDFLHYELKLVEDYLQHNTVGMGIPHVNPRILKNLRLIIPPLEEQEAIVRFLDEKTEKIDKLIGNKSRLIDLLEEKKTTIITNVVTQGLDPKTDKKTTEAKWLGRVPEHWEITTFRRFCTLSQGLQIAKSERFDEPGEDRYRYLTVEDINAGENYSSDYIEDPPENVVCNRDDVLLSRTGATGEVITDFHGAFHNNFFKVEFDRERIRKEFLVYYLRNKLIKENLLTKAGLTTVPDLNHRYFLDTTLLLPPEKEQEEIVEYLDSELEKYVDSIRIVKTGIERLKEYRAALITETVTGQIDVRGEV